jgi:hypothetical protein
MKKIACKNLLQFLLQPRHTKTGMSVESMEQRYTFQASFGGG